MTQTLVRTLVQQKTRSPTHVSGRIAARERAARTDLLQRQDELVEPPPLRQAHLGHRHVVEQRQNRDLVRAHPVFDTENVCVDHPVCHHRVKVQTFVHTRHFNTRSGAFSGLNGFNF